MLKISEEKLNDEILDELIRMSEEWEAEDSCWGYRRNGKEDIENERIFLAKEGDEILGYLFGHEHIQEEHSSVIRDNTKCFEIMEIYVRPEYRSKGIGKKLFAYLEQQLTDTDYLTLSTATKNWKAILHFYIEETGMAFHSARLFKEMQK